MPEKQYITNKPIKGLIIQDFKITTLDATEIGNIRDITVHMKMMSHHIPNNPTLDINSKTTLIDLTDCVHKMYSLDDQAFVLPTNSYYLCMIPKVELQSSCDAILDWNTIKQTRSYWDILLERYHGSWL